MSNIFTTLNLLGVAFVVLKLTGQISWPWVWVTFPIWLGPLMWLFLVVSLTIILKIWPD